MGLGRLSVGRMLLLMGASFLLPIALSSALLTRNLTHDISLAQLEVAGLRYQKPLVELQVGLVRYAALSREHTAAGLREASGTVDASFAALQALESALGERLQTTPESLLRQDKAGLELAKLETAWNGVKAEAPDLSAYERDAKLRELETDVLALIAYVGDSSTLILDPDLDSYYLMDLTTVVIPGGMQHVDAMLAKSAAAPSARPFDESDRVELYTLSALVQANDLEHGSASGRTALRSDADFYGASESLQRSLPPALEVHGMALLRLVGESRQLTTARDAGARRADFSAAALRALDASQTLWRVAAAELEKLLRIRSASLERERALALIVVAAALAAAAWLASRVAVNITRPLAQAVAVATSLVGDQAAQSLEAEGANASEILRATHALGGLAKSLRALVGRVKGTVEALGQSVEALSPVAEKIERSSAALGESSRQMDRDVEQTAQSLAVAAAAALQASQGVNELAAGSRTVRGEMEAARADVESVNELTRSVSVAVEELSSSLAEVSKSSSHSASIAESAARTVRETAVAFEALNASAQEIGNVVGLISDIADQTNLLALNARIEAASAGEAGRSFAVVANEVKELARQTALATQDIEGRISSVQSATRSAFEAVESILKLIDQMHENTRTVVAAVEEQTATSTEISSTLSEVAGRTDAISRAVASAADASARSASGADDLSAAAARLSSSVDEAAGIAGAARAVVGTVDRAAQENREISRIALATAQRVAAEVDELRELLREFQV